MSSAATVKMMSAQKLAKEAGVKDLEFVSITLDPAYDTPGVLKEYASVRGIDTSNFSFLTGPGKRDSRTCSRNSAWWPPSRAIC